MDNDLGKYKVTDRLTAIIDDPYHTADQTVQEIRGTLSDLKKVWSDGSLSDGYRQEKALRANGEPRENKSLKLYHGSRKTSRSILKT